MEEEKVIFPPRLPDGTTTDFLAFHSGAEFPQGGYVTALSAIAYLASGSEWFAAATGAHEGVEYATRDAVFAAGVWSTVQENLLHYFPQTDGIVAGEMELKRLLEGDKVHGIARLIGSQRSEPLPSFAYADWDRSFQTNVGLVLVPGYWAMKVNVAKLREAAPPTGDDVTAPAPFKRINRGPDPFREYPMMERVFKHFDERLGLSNMSHRARHEKLKGEWSKIADKVGREKCPAYAVVARCWGEYEARKPPAE